MQKKILASIVVIGLALLIWPVVAKINSQRDSITGSAVLDKANGEITLYKSLSCGCCGVYQGYLQNKGKYNLNVVQMDDLTSLKAENGIPSELQSCHTSVIDKYFVEGHVPLEAIDKLIAEKPDIKGIALAGMPSGAPGMTGSKKGDFIVYAVSNDGSYKEFIRL